MRKIFSTLFFFLLLFNALTLILILNFKISFLSPQKIKDIALKSNAYEFAAASIREGFSHEVDLKAGDGVFVEVLSESVTADVIQEISEGIVDQFFAVVAEPEKNQTLSISFVPIDEAIKQNFYAKTGLSLEEVGYTGLFGEEQEIVIGSNFAIALISNINNLIISGAVTVILLLGLVFVLSGKTASKRFSWIGANIFVLGLTLLAITLFAYILFPQLLDNQISEWGVVDPKLLIGVGKIIRIVLDGQRILLIVETVSALLLGIILFRFGRGIREEKVDVLTSPLQ